MKEVQDFKIDVAVLIIFFNRSETLSKVFQCVRDAKPSKLLLWQDGPRDNHPEDNEKIQACRDVVSTIDWNCEVHRQYNKVNFGCDPSTFNAHRWAFSIVDKCIVLEDDFVVSQSFFSYCKELLDKYEFDERVNHICGSNLLNISEECPYDYLFAYNGSAGWASWKRVIDSWDPSYSFLKDKFLLRNLRKKYGKEYFDLCYKNALKHAASGKAYWETLMGFNCMMNNRYAIISKRNFVSNIGMTGDSTHSLSQIKYMTKTEQRMFYKRTNELDHEIIHPPYIVPDYNYMQKVNRIKGVGFPLLRFYRLVYYYTNCLLHGEFGILFEGVRRRVKRILK